MSKGIPKTPRICIRCKNALAVRDYCATCAPIVRNEKKRQNHRDHDPLGMLTIDGAKRPPSMTIVKDALPLEYGGFAPGIKFVGKHDIMCMLTSGTFTDGTIVKANGKMLRIVNSRIEKIEA